MPKAVVNGAMLQCTCGDTPAPLTVTSQTQAQIGNQVAATIMDYAPAVNIAPFGTCKTLTSAASGVPTPCVPATVAPWTPGSTSIVTIGMFNALLDSDTLACTVGGSISIKQPGQQQTQDS